MDFKDLASKIYADLNDEKEQRGISFLKSLLLSGDVFLMEVHPLIKTERDYSPVNDIVKVNIETQSLFVYEPYHLKLEYERKIDKLRNALEFYADQTNYSYKQLSASSADKSLYKSILIDGGEYAREALKECEE